LGQAWSLYAFFVGHLDIDVWTSQQKLTDFWTSQQKLTDLKDGGQNDEL
jgi:hypothetical protein